MEGSAETNLIEYVTIVLLGNATNFGDLTVIRQEMGGVHSVRAVTGGGVVGPAQN